MSSIFPISKWKMELTILGEELKLKILFEMYHEPWKKAFTSSKNCSPDVNALASGRKSSAINLTCDPINWVPYQDVPGPSILLQTMDAPCSVLMLVSMDNLTVWI